MRSALRVLLLALLVVTAGCSGAFGGESSDDSPPNGATTTEADALPPGLTTGGLADSDALVNAHVEELDGESLTRRETRVRRYDNGTLRWQMYRTLRTAANRTRWLVVTDVVGRPVFGATEGHVAVFADGQRVYRSVTTPNASWSDLLRTATGDSETPRNLALDAARTDDLYVLLNAFASNESANVWKSVTHSGEYRVESSTLAYPDLLASHLNLAEVRNATLTAVVTADGRIVEYRVEYVGTEHGEIVHGTVTLQYSMVGETTVEVPAWYEAAKERAEKGETTQDS